MCKILTFTNGAKLNTSDIQKIGQEMLYLDPDGFGYAIKGTKGIFGEKYIGSKFTVSITNTKPLPKMLLEPLRETFGEYSKIDGPALFHGRTSTNCLNLNNTHPIQKNNWNLIHNGVVTDHGPKYKMITTNDSEHVLEHLINGGIKEVSEHLSGYYAFTAIDPNGLLHICRDDVAKLFSTWSPSHETYIFSTTPDLLTNIAKLCNITIDSIELVKSETYSTWNNNELINAETFNSRGFTSHEQKHSKRSLGYDLPNSGDNIVDVTDTGDNYNYDDYNDDYYNELDYLDDEYKIYDDHGSRMTVSEFYQLDDINQLLCTIVRPDGTEINLTKYEKYYAG